MRPDGRRDPENERRAAGRHEDARAKAALDAEKAEAAIPRLARADVIRRADRRSAAPAAARRRGCDDNRRKVREGIVVSDAMSATVVVAVVERVRHPKYGKTVQRTKKLYVHDAEDSAKVGDRVRIRDPPLSKLKRWRLDRGRGAGPMIQQESRLRVADNSGAARCSASACSAAQPALRQHRRRVRGHGQGRHPGCRRQEGRGRQVRRRADEEGEASSGRQLHPLRRERRRSHQRPATAAGDPHLRAGRPRAARQALHAHRVARTGGALNADPQGRQVVVLSGKDKGKKAEVVGPSRAATASSSRASTWPSATPSQRVPPSRAA